jgi:hypothetical protein
MNNNQAISRQLQQLEAYVTSVVAALARKELPININRVVQIFDATFGQIPSFLDLPQGKFVEIYNDVPSILMAYAIDATLSDESYRQSNSMVTFNRFPQGNYWIIHKDRTDGTAWLVPNPLRRIAFDRLKSIEFSFDRNFTTTGDQDLVVLHTPAIVQLLPTTESLSWKLIQRGKITNEAGMPQNKIDQHELTSQIRSIVVEEFAKLEPTRKIEISESVESINQSTPKNVTENLDNDKQDQLPFTLDDNLKVDTKEELSFGDLWRQSLADDL